MTAGGTVTAVRRDGDDVRVDEMRQRDDEGTVRGIGTATVVLPAWTRAATGYPNDTRAIKK
jgi:hypothetical protein